MKNLIKHIFVVCFSGFLLASCATTEGGAGGERDLDYRGSDCISIRTIRDYTPLDDRSLLIKTAGKRNYFVTLVTPSFDLRSSFQLGFSSRDDWLCPYGGDRLIIEGLPNDHVAIRSVSRLTPEQAEDLLIKYGKKKEPEEQQDKAPPELKGADVEELG